MPKLLFKLEAETETDIRANEIAYILTVENVGTTTIELESLKARIPTDVTLSEIKNHTFKALKAKQADLLKELNLLLNNFLFIENEQIRQRQTEILKKTIKNTYQLQGGMYALLITLPVNILSGALARSLTESKAAIEAYSVKIENCKNAKEEFTRWLENNPKAENAYEKKCYESKLSELEELEKEMSEGDHLFSLATLEPDTSFSQTYVFKFERNDWTPKKYNISVDVVYSETSSNPDDKIRIYSGSASVCPTISPSPKRLTFLAVSSSLLGVLVNWAVEVSKNNPTLPDSLESINKALNHPISAQFALYALISPIAALVFFNIYEYTELGKNFNMGISWRSALLIGTLCGLFADKIFEALKVFV